MNIILIADGHPREWPILAALSQQFPSAVWIQPQYETENSKSTFKKISQLLRNWPRLYNRLRSRTHRTITKQKIDSIAPDFEHHIQLPAQELEQEKGQQLLDRFQPDILVTCRAPILPPEILAKVNWCGINVHFGIIPAYRGNDGLFWALTNSDWDALGGSIHLLDEGVDTGAKLIDVYPELQKGASLISVELKVSRILAEALVSCLKKIAVQKKAPQGMSAESDGHNYRRNERTPTKDLTYLRNRILETVPAQGRQVQYFF